MTCLLLFRSAIVILFIAKFPKSNGHLPLPLINTTLKLMAISLCIHLLLPAINNDIQQTISSSFPVIIGMISIRW